jgi:CheY-like chemotaxis protein
MPELHPMDLPVEKSQATGRSSLPKVPENPGVLVVDDEHLVRIMVQLGLERSGFQIWLASNGREAIEFYRENREQIALVLLDVRMPGLDGPETLKALRELNPKVLAGFMSGDMGSYNPEKLFQCGAAFYIAKPFHLDKLTAILLQMLEARPADFLSFIDG